MIDQIPGGCLRRFVLVHGEGDGVQEITTISERIQ